MLVCVCVCVCVCLCGVCVSERVYFVQCNLFPYWQQLNDLNYNFTKLFSVFHLLCVYMRAYVDVCMCACMHACVCVPVLFTLTPVNHGLLAGQV